MDLFGAIGTAMEIVEEGAEVAEGLSPLALGGIVAASAVAGGITVAAITHTMGKGGTEGKKKKSKKEKAAAPATA